MKVFDSPYARVCAANADSIKKAGYDAGLFYYFKGESFKELLTVDSVNAFHNAGLEVGAIYECGQPTSAAYFTPARAAIDAENAIDCAYAAAQSSKTPIFFAVDYDAEYAQILPYFQQLYMTFNHLDYGYEIGVYGNGIICGKLISAGLAKRTFLAQSTGWRGYELWKPSADIVQSAAFDLLGTIDADEGDSPSLDWAW